MHSLGWRRCIHWGEVWKDRTGEDAVGGLRCGKNTCTLTVGILSFAATIFRFLSKEPEKLSYVL